jgi:hypothetical protein
VTVSGTSFTGTTSVRFSNGIAASFTVTSSTQIKATVPAGAVTGPVTVTAPGGTVTSATSFTVLPSPTVASFTPSGGAIGDPVTIAGTNFTSPATVSFGASAPTTAQVLSSTSLSTTVPNDATTGPLTVATSGGSATSAAGFNVYTNTQAPTITSFTPTHGPAGTSVTLTGASFVGPLRVTFNDVPATFVRIVSATTIMTTVPSCGSTGRIRVISDSLGTGVSPADFVVDGGGPVCNPGFESGPTVAWVPVSFSGLPQVVNAMAAADGGTVSPAAGSWMARLDSYGASDYLYQNILIPSGSRCLSFRYQIRSAELNTSVAHDFLDVKLLDAGGVSLLSALATLDNLDAGTFWSAASLPIPGTLAGRSVQLRFELRGDSFYNTDFFLDDVQVVPCP